MIGLSTAVGLFNFIAHEHEEEPIRGLPYQKIRTKPYPWSCSDCNLFDIPCWDECKGRNHGKAAAAHH